MIILFLILFLVIVFIGVPIAFSLAATGMAIMVWQGIFNPIILGHIMYQGLDSFPFLAIPFFMLAGSIMEKAEITKRIMDFAYSIVGRLRGGLGHIAVVMSMIFAAMSGSGVATAAAIGSLLLPTMEERGYKKGFSAALIASGGAIGPIIPPSIPMIIYAVIAGVSVERMFLGGVIPGILYGLFLMAYSTYYAKKNNLPKETEKLDIKTTMINLKKATLPLLLPGIILVGIFSGMFTATESAVVAVVYALILGMFIYKKIGIKDLPKIFLDAINNTATVMIILSTSAILNWVLTSQQIPQQMASALMSLSSSPTVILSVLMLLILVLGCFMDALALILLLSPMALSVTNSMGIDPIFFGVILVVNICIGALTPPVGANLFIASKIGNVSLEETSVQIIPMMLLAVLVLFICVLFPQLVLFLPRILLG